jgi:hypothetical protein
MTKEPDVNGQQRRRRLLSAIRKELAKVGHPLTTAERVRMASVLDRMDRITNREDALSLSAELERDSEHADDGGSPCAVAPAWLKHAECA